MKLPVVVTDRAEADVKAIAKQCELRRPGESVVFRVRFELTSRQIEQFPESCEEIDGVYRRAMLGRFPFFVAYRLLPDHVRILRVLPERADPRAHARELREADD
jgi:plasmid stabilization system protein ParE